MTRSLPVAVPADTSPRVLVVDTSPGLGGATTSLIALADVAADDGLAMHVAATHRDGWDSGGLRASWSRLTPAAHRDVHGVAWARREVARARTLFSVARRFRPTVVLGNNSPGANACAAMVAATLRLPYVQYCRSEVAASRAVAGILRNAHSVLCVGHEVTQSVQRLAPFSRPVLVSEGLSSSQWPMPRRADADRWLWCSALVGWKGLELTLDAYRRTARALPDGPPPLDIAAAPLSDAHPDAVCLPSALPAGTSVHLAPRDLDTLRAGAQVYIHSSLHPEPFGRSLLEAMAAGLCPVVPDQGTPARLIRDGVEGLVYKTGDAADLTRVLTFLAQNPDRALAFGRAAHRVALGFGAETAFEPVLDALHAAHQSQTTGRSRSPLSFPTAASAGPVLASLEPHRCPPPQTHLRPP